MNKFAVNLTTIFTEVPFMERFQKAREAGFSFIECQFPYIYSIEEIQRELEQHQLSMVLHNLPPGNWDVGDRGIAVDANHVTEFRQSVQTGIQYAKALKVSRIHCMAGVTPDLGDQQALNTYIENIKFAANEFAKHNITLLMEPINDFDMPGYFLNHLEQATKIIDRVHLPNVKLQFDFYHIERIHGNSLSLFKQYRELVGHVQIADVPGRHEPGTGKLDYQSIFQYLNDTYDGYIGLEYTPKKQSEESFKWLFERENGGN
ncbi:TIM barrel protein [Bacillus sp. B15-48]|uniref:hydroxypyruvate isomerase family protein n=1 Tax=Bacillus sp. B15-48 TaxID=1548601 RepID=UPI00193F5A52|nr:TIM barrel protein [Bacillus sp. B15-48]MBM4763140.1 TIM barrel protein [Bacillus sp. B15-48]